jgi:signal transduction histidine kinase/PAS domain-containing protein
MPDDESKAGTEPNGVDGRVEIDRDGIVRIARDGTIADWDDVARRVFGRPRSRAQGRRFAALFAQECRDDVEALTAGSRQAPGRLVATAIRSGRGPRFKAEVTTTPENGHAGLVVLVRDVTAPAAAAAAARVVSASPGSARALTSLTEELRRWMPLLYVNLGIIEGERYRRIADPENHPITLVDGQRLRLRGRPVAAALASRAPVVVHDTRKPRFRCDEKLAAVGIASYAVVPIMRGDEIFATLNVGFERPRGPTTSVLEILSAVCAAIADPLAATLELEDQARTVRRLEAVDRLEKDFLAAATHDMRTPLTVIAGFATNLRENWDELPDAEKLESVEAIARNADSLTQLVEQDLEVALIERGRMPYEIETFDLAAQVDDIVRDFSKTMPNRFVVHVEESLPLVRGDAQRNRQVLVNLLTNAVQFSKRSSPVELEVSRAGAMAQVAVHDQGIGIDAADIPVIFRKYSRVRTRVERRSNGAGLGLYLSKCFVEAQGGRIWVESASGEGSTFTYTLPVAG